MRVQSCASCSCMFVLSYGFLNLKYLPCSEAYVPASERRPKSRAVTGLQLGWGHEIEPLWG